jgi:copper resistance protein B
LRALAALALASAASLGTAASAQEPMDGMAHHARTYTFLQAELDAGRGEGGAEQATWEVDGWIGGDRRKLWLKSEGEFGEGELESAEVQALYSRTIGTFFDAQVGVRYDFEPRGTAYLAAGVHGLAPHLLETDLAGFLSEDGDVSARLEQSFDVLLSQRLILEPRVEVELQAQDVPERGLGAGVTDVEAGLQLRYEITRKFAPYAEAVYDRAMGETAGLRRAEGEDPGGWAVRVGLRAWM